MGFGSPSSWSRTLGHRNRRVRFDLLYRCVRIARASENLQRTPYVRRGCCDWRTETAGLACVRSWIPSETGVAGTIDLAGRGGGFEAVAAVGQVGQPARGWRDCD